MVEITECILVGDSRPLGWWQLRLPPSALIPFGQGVARYLGVLAAAVAFARIALSGLRLLGITT